MPLGVAPSAVAVIADAQPLPCAACLCGKEGEGERERGGERVLTVAYVYVVRMTPRMQQKEMFTMGRL